MAGRYVAVLKNNRFAAMPLAFAVMGLPHFAFIGGSPAIYISGFGLSEQVVGLYFALNALGFMLGSFACTRLAGSLSPMRIIVGSLVVMFVAGGSLVLLGGTSPLTVALPMCCVAFAVGFSRPVSNSMVLDEVDNDIGAASSVMTFEMFLIGGLGMELISLEWPSKVAVLGKFTLVGAAVPFVVLALIRLAGKRVA